MAVLDREAAAAAVESEYPRYAGLLRDDSTSIAKREAPMLRDGVIYRVEHAGPHHPVLFFLGVTPGGTEVLTNDLEAFERFAKASGVSLETEKDVLDYVLAFLEVTRDTSTLVYRIDSVDQIRFRPTSTDEERRAQDEFVEENRNVIAAPAVSSMGDSSRVEFFVVSGPRVQRNTFDVSPDGTIEPSFEVIAEDLPLTIGR